jgi:carboxyl-terminal processing protease
VSKNSASASEIVAGALQSIGRAVIVGDTTTHGKGTVQAPWPLERTAMQNNPFRKRDKKLGTVKVTIQKFYLPDGASTQLEGVKSDIVIPNTNDYREIGEADLDNAMPWDSIAPEKWSPNSVLPENAPQVNNVVLNILQNRSKQRIETMEEFSYLNEIIERFRERKEKKGILTQTCNS